MAQAPAGPPAGKKPAGVGHGDDDEAGDAEVDPADLAIGDDLVAGTGPSGEDAEQPGGVADRHRCQVDGPPEPDGLRRGHARLLGASSVTDVPDAPFPAAGADGASCGSDAGPGPGSGSTASVGEAASAAAAGAAAAGSASGVASTASWRATRSSSRIPRSSPHSSRRSADSHSVAPTPKRNRPTSPPDRRYGSCSAGEAVPLAPFQPPNSATPPARGGAPATTRPQWRRAPLRKATPPPHP